MNWHNFFTDLEKWMQASNVMLNRDGFGSEQYWQWLIGTLGVIERRYHAHPLVVSILADVAKYQDECYKQYHQKEDNNEKSN